MSEFVLVIYNELSTLKRKIKAHHRGLPEQGSTPVHPSTRVKGCTRGIAGEAETYLMCTTVTPSWFRTKEMVEEPVLTSEKSKILN